MCKRRGFTLVELLVVIGIIAVLISILLPALNSARRSANAVKCATAMREMGNAIQLYAIEYKGYCPPARVDVSATNPYVINGFSYTGSGTLFLQSFIAKYVTKGKYSTESTTDQQAADMRRTILWGCPAWDGYVSNTVGGVNRVQSGIGVNPYASRSPAYPAIGVSLKTYPDQNVIESSSLYAVTSPPPTTTTAGWSRFEGTWWKLAQYKQPSQKCMMADSLFWLVESASPASTWTEADLPGEKMMTNSGSIYLTGGTTIDWYRHGKYPNPDPANAGFFNKNGGKIAYNILYADGHVGAATDKAEAYRSTRMRFPG